MNAVDVAARQLRRMIFDGELRANQALRQEDLAAQLGTSRHPVREALGRLTGEGLVSFQPRRGYTVVGLQVEEVTEIFDMRAVLEEHAGYLATLKRTDRDIAEVGAILGKMERLHAEKHPKIATWGAYNHEFHARLFASSGRGHLCRIIGVLRDSVESYIRDSVAHNLQSALAMHQEIYDGFRDGDAIHVARLSRRHVRHSAQALLDRLKAASQDGVDPSIENLRKARMAPKTDPSRAKRPGVEP
jgi:DNA-binding GntR family transcriptional regulator